jgi:hypothetical protein
VSKPKTIESLFYIIETKNFRMLKDKSQFEELFRKRKKPYEDHYGEISIAIYIAKKLLVVYLYSEDDGWYYIDRQQNFYYCFPN